MRIFVTGMTGFLGHQLGMKLLEKGHKVGTLARNVATSDRPIASNTESMIRGETVSGISYYYGDLTDSSNISRLVKEINPNEIYNLGAQSHVAVSFEIPEYTSEVSGLGSLRILESMRFLGLKKTKFYQNILERFVIN